MTIGKINAIAKKYQGYPFPSGELTQRDLDSVLLSIGFIQKYLTSAVGYNEKTTSFRLMAEKVCKPNYIGKFHMLIAYDLLGIPVKLERRGKGYGHYFHAKVKMQRKSDYKVLRGW